MRLDGTKEKGICLGDFIDEMIKLRPKRRKSAWKWVDEHQEVEKKKKKM